MENLHDWIGRHPYGPALVFIALGAWGAWCAYRGGMAAAIIRGNAALAASENLGG